MIKNTIKVNDNNTVTVTKAFAKNARIYGTPEYKIWREIKLENPDFVMVTKSIKKNPDKKTNRNLTYENMRIFINEQKDAKELIIEFERQIRLSKVQTSPYCAVLAWFKKTFENYDSYKAFLKALKEKDETSHTNNETRPVVAKAI